MKAGGIVGGLELWRLFLGSSFLFFVVENFK